MFNQEDSIQADTLEQKKNSKKNYIILWLLLIALIWGIWAFIYFNFIKGAGTPTETPWNNQTIGLVDPDISRTIEEKAEETFLLAEKQKFVEFLNQRIMPNYMKISAWKDFEKFGTYSEKDVSFFTLSFEPNVTPETLADYDVYMLKGHDSEEDYHNSDELYKKRTEMMLREDLTKWSQKKIMEKGVVGVIKKIATHNYTIDFLWDYIIDKWWKSKTISPQLAWQIAVIGEYLNYGETYLFKDGEDIAEILFKVEAELNDKEFSTLAENIKKVYFKDVKKK